MTLHFPFCSCSLLSAAFFSDPRQNRSELLRCILFLVLAVTRLYLLLFTQAAALYQEFTCYISLFFSVSIAIIFNHSTFPAVTTVFTLSLFTAGDTKSFCTYSPDILPDGLLVGSPDGILFGPFIGSFDHSPNALTVGLLVTSARRLARSF